MRILITGGAGFIGTNLTLKAAAAGYGIVVLDNFAREGTKANLRLLRELPNVEVIQHDVRQPLREQWRVDCIVHLAANVAAETAFRDPGYDLTVNGLGTVNVLEYARRFGKAPVIYTSTCKVYSTGINKLPLKELERRYDFESLRGVDESFEIDSQCLHAHGPYGCSKYVGEFYAQEYHALYGLPVIVNRLSTIYGPHQHGVDGYGWVYWFTKAAKCDLPVTIYGNGKQVRDVLHVEDLCRLLLKQIEHVERYNGNIYNIGGGPERTLSILELLDMLAELKRAPLRNEIMFREPRPADFKIYVSNIVKITMDAEWNPEIAPREGVERLWREL